MDTNYISLGMLVGRQIIGMRKVAEKEPVAYLYNGVRLPKLPEMAYPFMIISLNHSTNEYAAYALSNEVHGEKFGFQLYYMSAAPYDCYRVENGEWAFWFAQEDGNLNSNPKTHTIVWADHDIIDADGSVYLAASEPVPVYE